MSTKFEFENLEDLTDEQKDALKDEFEAVYYPILEEFQDQFNNVITDAGIALDAATEMVLGDLKRKGELDPIVAEHLLPIQIDPNLHQAYVKTGKIMTDALLGEHQHKPLTDSSHSALRQIRSTRRILDNARAPIGHELNSIVKGSDYMSNETIQQWAEHVVLSACLNRVTKDKLHKLAVENGDAMISVGMKELKGNKLYESFVESAKGLKAECNKFRPSEPGHKTPTP